MHAIQPPVEAGYFIDERVFSDVECEQLLNGLTDSSIIRRGRAGSRHLMSQSDVRHAASDPRMLRIAYRALGTEAVPYRATLFEKSGGANWLVVWHQDTALPLRSQFDRPEWGPWSRKAGVLYAHAPSWAVSHIVALRIHLDDSTSDNGPLRILPGTHSWGVMSDADVFALARSQVHVDCIVGRGGVMAMSPLLVHSSGKARCRAPRRVLHIEYADSLTLGSDIQLAIV
jgi:hypothetical protein